MKSWKALLICHGMTQKHMWLSANFSNGLDLIFVLYTYKYI